MPLVLRWDAHLWRRVARHALRLAPIVATSEDTTCLINFLGYCTEQTGCGVIPVLFLVAQGFAQVLDYSRQLCKGPQSRGRMHLSLWIR